MRKFHIFHIKFQIILSILALCSFVIGDDNGTVSETRIIPIARVNFPLTHERIMVPVDPDPVEAKEINDKPVNEPSRETNLRKRHRHYEKEHVEVPVEKPKQTKRNPQKSDNGKGNNRGSYSYVARSDNPRALKDADSIQPLNINTKVFKKTPPNENEKPPTGKYQSRIRVKNPEDIHEMKNMVKDSRKKLKKENLPENPVDVPMTSWFDNTGKYNYGIVHNIMEPEIYKNKETESPKQEQARQIAPDQAPQVFKSSFRDPSAPSARVEHKASGPNLGNFLYKSEVFYPPYRDNLYPPAVTYGDPTIDVRPATKELPATNLHKPPPRPAPTEEDETPKQQAKPQVKQQKPKERQQEEENEEDYEDESGGDYEDPGNNDKYDGEAPGDEEDSGDPENQEEEEESADDRSENGSEEDDGEEDGEEKSDDESEESPKERYAYNKIPKYKYSFDSDGRHNSGSGESDEFERAWSKFGYGPKNTRSILDEEEEDEDKSYESSETQIQPQRIKFHYEKKEQITTPNVQHTTKATVPKKKLARSMSGSITNHKPKALPKKVVKSDEKTSPQPDTNQDERSPESVKSQVNKSQPTDDLKYFQ